MMKQVEKKKCSLKNFFQNFWYIFPILIFFVGVILLYLVCGEDSYISIHDNLDLFTPQFQMMKNDGTFFSQSASTDFLDGISRNVLPSEFSLYTVLYMIFPSFSAYVIGYLLKIVIAIIGGGLLGADMLFDFRDKENTAKNKLMPVIILCSFAYGILNLFPAFGIPFASIPLIIYFLRRAYKTGFKRYYIYILLYPFLSYFSYFGIFIMGYLVIAIIWISIRDKKFSKRLLISLIMLVIGSVLCEYRLFATMLFSDEVTIRSSMVVANLSLSEIFSQMADVFVNGMMHANDAHLYIVMPVCIVYFLYINIKYIVKKNAKMILCDSYNLLALCLIFNTVIYGLYYFEPFRNLVEMLVPPLTGWQFNRTIFFNPFIWYAEFTLVMCRMIIFAYKSAKRAFLKYIAYILIAASVLVILIQPALPLGDSTRYDDLYTTAYGTYYKICHDGQTVDTLSFREFFDTDLFEEIKENIDYNEGEMAVAYGLYPAQLEYNDISTLDGYLGFYSQEYKDKFRKVIAPALELQEASRIYFDNSGIRCYLYSGTESSIPMYTKSLSGITAEDLYVDMDALKDLDCKYIFSRIELTNADDLEINLLGCFEGSAYKIYVYEV